MRRIVHREHIVQPHFVSLFVILHIKLSLPYRIHNSPPFTLLSRCTPINSLFHEKKEKMQARALTINDKSTYMRADSGQMRHGGPRFNQAAHAACPQRRPRQHRGSQAERGKRLFVGTIVRVPAAAGTPATLNKKVLGVVLEDEQP